MTWPAKNIKYSCPTLIGMCGIENISWENRNGEISILLAPDRWGEFDAVLDEVLRLGFNNLNLENLYTEVYGCNLQAERWHQCETRKTAPSYAILPNRKFWDGDYYDSLYINFNREEYNKCE
jgi:hypothetical protein